MPRLEVRWSGDQAIPQLFQPRDDLILERRDGDGTFVQADGPFSEYQRTVTGTPGAEVTEVIRYHLAIPWFGWLFVWPTRRSLRRPPTERLHGGRQPWWAPPQRLDPRAARVLGLLAVAEMVTGFCSTLFSQTAAFAADEFGASERAQGVAGTIIRLGIVFTVALLMLADRIGRRKIMVGTLIVAPVLAAVGALAPSLWSLTAIQTVARPVALALGLVVSIVAAEEMPPGCRAYAVSVLGLAYALGVGTCIWVLPLADVGLQGWRLVYAAGLAYVVLALFIVRDVPESRRYELPHAERPALPGGRFVLIAVSVFLFNILIAPSTFYENRYLKDERGYSATMIALYTVVTSTPGALGVLAGGRIADVKGRKVVGAVALVATAVGTVLVFSVMGGTLWTIKLITSILGGAALPALGVYAAELFPTTRRGGANGWISACSIVGSVTGLLLAGQLLDQGATYGTVMAILSVGPLIYAALVIFAYPETAKRSLDDINPEDRTAA